MMNLIKSAEVYGAEAVVYTGSNSPPEEFLRLIVNDELMPGMGDGSLYGKGVYTVYNLSGTITERGGYGDYIYKLKVNLYGFISFNPDITKQIYGQDLTPSKQYERISGKKGYIFEILKNLEESSKLLDDSQFSSDLAKEASQILKGKVKGILFTGRRDGDVAVIYDPQTIVPVAWMSADLDDFTDTWHSFSKEVIKPAIGRGISGSFQESKYEQPNIDVEFYNAEKFLSNFNGKKIDEKGLRYINYFIKQSPYKFLLMYWCFRKKDWAEPYVGLAAETLARESPSLFLNEFRTQSWAQNYLCLAAERLMMQDPDYFIERWGEEPWAKDCIIASAKILAESDPYYFLLEFSTEPWAQAYIELAKEKLSNKNANPISPTASNRSAKILKLSKALLSLGHIKEIDAIKSLVSNNYKIASDEKISGKFKLENLNESQKEELYRVFEESYIKATGQAWSSGLFFSRASSWTFYGIVGGLASGVVAIREQFGGLNKLVAIAGNPRGVLLGIKTLKEDKSNDPIWGAISPEMVPMVERFGFKAATKEELTDIAKNLPNYIRREIGDINPDGSFKMNIAEVGETTKQFVYNNVYGDMFCQK